MIFDPLCQYQPDESFTAICHQPVDLKEAIRRAHHGRFRILYQPARGIIKHWRAVGQIALAEGDMLICIDEIGLLCEGGKFKPDYAGGDDDERNTLFEILHMGRHRDLKMIATCQIPTDVAYRYRQLATELRIFQTDDPDQVKTLGKRVGQVNADRLPSLPKYAFLHWTDAGDVTVCVPKKGGL